MGTLIHKLNIETVAFLILIFTFSLSYLLIPKLIDIIKYMNLMDKPDVRSSHKDETPTLGGIVFYISIVLSLYIIHFFDNVDISFNIITGLTILFFVGIKDDLMVLSAGSKVVVQLVAITFILLNSDLHIISFNGFLGVNEIPFLLMIIFSYLIVIFIINAYNLIDGIDGLAGMLGILIFTIYAILFYQLKLYLYFLLTSMSIGFLMAFLRYNLSKNKKIFMGDTGSMIIGFLIGILTLRFLALNTFQFTEIHIKPQNALLIVLVILFFPTIDVTRVVFMRLINKKKPFQADRCHMHHILVDKGLSHKKASTVLIFSSIFIFLVIFFMNTLLNYFGLIILFFFLTLFTYFVLLILDSDRSARKYRKRFRSYFPKEFQFWEFRIRKKIIITLKELFFKNLN